MNQPAHLLASLHRTFEPGGTHVWLGQGAVVGAPSLRREALHEVYAAAAGDSAAASGFAVALAERLCAGRTILWIRQDISAREHGEIDGNGLLELGVDPAKFLVLRVAHAKDALKAACDGLTCASLGTMIVEIQGEHKVLDLTATRRLTLAAARDGVSAVLLRLGADADASAAETRWIVRSAPSASAEDFGFARFEATLARNRHGRSGRWIMQWNGDDGSFHEQQAHPVGVVAAPAHGPVAAQGRSERDWRRAG
jgi:protein ImuA